MMCGCCEAIIIPWSELEGLIMNLRNSFISYIPNPSPCIFSLLTPALHNPKIPAVLNIWLFMIYQIPNCWELDIIEASQHWKLVLHSHDQVKLDKKVTSMPFSTRLACI